MDYFFSPSSVVSSDRILYTPSPFARSSLLYLQEIGELEALQQHTSSREHLASCLFFMVKAGEGKLFYENREYQLQPGSCVFIDCDSPYAHATDTNLWTIRWAHFHGPALPSVYAKYRERGGQAAFSPSAAVFVKLEESWQVLMAAAKSDDYVRDMVINQHLAALLTVLMRESWHPEGKRNVSKGALALDVKEYIDGHFSEELTLDQLSGRFYINKYYLSKSFKAQFGQTLSSYIQMVRVTQAKRLLRFTSKTVEEIGEMVGIRPASYFSEVFNAVEGVSPSVYRKMW